MYELRVHVEFSAAHHLEGYPGDCARPHGHNYKVEFFARARGLDQIGLALDFRTLKNAAKEIVAPWDHQDLNRQDDFRSTPTSAENIARLCFERMEGYLRERIPAGTCHLDRVTVWETPHAAATYFRDPIREN